MVRVRETRRENGVEGRRERAGCADRECVLGWCEDAWTSTTAPERPRFPFLLPRSVTSSDERPRTHGPAQLRRPCKGRSDVMSLRAQASVFSRSFLLQPRPIDDVYRWVRIDFGVAVFTLAAIALCCLARLRRRQDAPLRSSTSQVSTRGPHP